MNQSTYTTDTTTGRDKYVDRTDNKLIKMILPFIVGLILGYGANGLVEKGQHEANNNTPNQSAPMNDGR